jgi:hypothetical protein
LVNIVTIAAESAIAKPHCILDVEQTLMLRQEVSARTPHRHERSLLVLIEVEVFQTRRLFHALYAAAKLARSILKQTV